MKRYKKTRFVHKDAITGYWVSAAYAKSHPHTTIKLRVRLGKQSLPKGVCPTTN